MTSQSTGEPQPLQTFWQIKAPSGRIITCAAYQGFKARMVELRVGYDYSRPLMIEHAANLLLAGRRAGQLLETFQDRDGFELLPS